MRKVVLIFPDVISLAEFVLTYRPSKVIVNSYEKKLSGTIQEKLFDIACKTYKAKVKESVAVKHFG